jgi:hypothetical protein
MDVTLTATKICSACGDELPLDRFRLRRATGVSRDNRCRGCYNRWMRDYRRTRRSESLQAFAAAVAKETSFRRVEQLCDQMFRRFGGVGEFAKLWVSEIKAAGQTKRGTPRALKAMLAIANMQALVQLNERPSSFSELSYDQLREVMERKLADLLRSGRPCAKSP